MVDGRRLTMYLGGARCLDDSQDWDGSLDRTQTVALATDLYQMTMGASYHALGIDQPATFSLFVRRLPPNRSYLVAAGLEEALDRLVKLRFDADALDYLASVGQIRGDFIEALSHFRFEGEVFAVPEGRVVFAGEPLLEVRSSVLAGQIAETLILNAMHYPTVVASKAVRYVNAAKGRALVEFGLRRTPGLDAGLAAARASYITGFAATSNLMAGQRYGIPVSGTVAHSFIQIFPSELQAFRAFAETFPGPVTLLIDTYDTIQGARHAAVVARERRAEGGRVLAVRIDSGDLVAMSREARKIFDRQGLSDIQIIASGGLDEWDVAELVASGAPIDSFGVGTQLVNSADAPSLDMVYKLVEFDQEFRLKLSPDKATYGGAKQVWRQSDNAGQFVRDLITGREEESPGPDWESLLVPVLRDREIVLSQSLEQIRQNHQSDIRRLPQALHELDGGGNYPVSFSPALERRQRQAIEEVRRRELGSEV